MSQILNNQKKITIPIPFLGIVYINQCKGIRYNHKLFTQCGNIISDNDEQQYCHYCNNQAKLSVNNTPIYGNIYDRLTLYNENKLFFHNGIKEELYGNVLNKLKIPKEKVIKIFNEMNIKYSNDIFNTTSKNRGRPKKDISENNIIEKKPRGRPKKKQCTLKLDDLYDIETIVNVKEIIINNNKYYQDSNNNIYNVNFEIIEI